jgi:hypothetical protein
LGEKLNNEINCVSIKLQIPVVALKKCAVAGGVIHTATSYSSTPI